MLVNSLRRAKRLLLYKGYAKPVYHFLSDIEKDREEAFHKEGSYVVNLSFDLEFALHTRFWVGEYEKALTYGRIGRENLRPLTEYLFQEKVPYNVQIVAALLDRDSLAELPVNEAQRAFMERHEELFVLSDPDLELIEKGHTEIGLHGFSHRRFGEIDVSDARFELQKGVEIFKRTIRKDPLFMSFPKNDVAHTEVLLEEGIKAWRGKTQKTDEHMIPNGLWFAPGNLDERSLGTLLKRLRKERNGYFLHLWGHFTEMELSTFRTLIGVIRDNGWVFQTVRGYKDQYE